MKIRAKNRTIDLNEIHTILENARMAHIAAWNEFKDLPVPIKFKAFDKKLRMAANMHIKALDEQLLYFKDNKSSHIEKGTDMYIEALNQMGTCLKEHNKLVKSYKIKPQN